MNEELIVSEENRAQTLQNNDSSEQVNLHEWISINQATKIFGLTRDEILKSIKEGKIPFRMRGTRYRINARLARCYLCKQDIQNMKKIEYELRFDKYGKRVPKVSKVIV